MKKLFIAALALASVACTKSEVLETAPQKAISFGKPFVENSTKAIDPSLTATTFKQFYVYGTISNGTATANIFNGELVSKDIPSNPGVSDNTYGTWGYAATATQYWIPDNAYAFKAVSGVEKAAISADNATKMPTSISYDATSQKDLVYAINNFGVFGTGEGKNSETCVAFAFNHLLSKAKFSFTTDYPNGYSVKVTSVKITNANSNGVYTLNANAEKAPFGTWEPTVPTELDFGNVVASDATAAAESIAIVNTDANTKNSSLYERLMIPASYEEVRIVYSYEVYYTDGTNTVKVMTVTDKTASVDKVVLNEGCSYNFTGIIKHNMKAITFTVNKLNGWTPANPNPTVN